MEFRPLNILCVDDDAVSRELLRDHLVAAGHDVVACDAAHAAIELLEARRFQIVIADWVMPTMSGLDLCRWVRARADSALHFVMLTVHSDKERLIEAFEAGVDDFLSKPLHEGELLARLRAWGRIISLQEELTRLATSDDLTGLPNRREGERRLGERFAAAGRDGVGLACAMVDVDRFKEFNDTCGHAVGDRVLRCVATTLRATVRPGDEVFRIGGDEFLVVFRPGGAEEATACALCCREAVSARPFSVDGRRMAITISVGVARRVAGMADAAALLGAADDALYAAKAGGRNHVRVLPGRAAS